MMFAMRLHALDLACVFASLLAGCQLHVAPAYDTTSFNDLFAGTEVVFMVRHEPQGDMLVYDRQGVDERHPPCSTFKIWNTLIGLETGVITGRDFTLQWDPKRDPVQPHWPTSWQRSHTLESAFRNSVYWYYQKVARRVGRERMQRALDALDFGNRDMSGGADCFWLESTLAVSPREQVALLGRLINGDVPFQTGHIALVKELMLHEDGGDVYTLRGKTGLGRLADGRLEGWYVGWVEVGSYASPFALYMRTDTFDQIHRQRKAHALAALRALEVIPPNTSR